jgi:hypothetical protein
MALRRVLVSIGNLLLKDSYCRVQQSQGLYLQPCLCGLGLAD